MDSSQLKICLDFAVDAARAAGDLTVEYFRHGVAVEVKADQSPVTEADRRAEVLLRDRIEQAFPDHGIVGEEYGIKEGRSPARWILDPIDGTFSFICGVPLYTTLVGLEWAGTMVVGVINAPAIGEIVAAARGLGCTCNGRPAEVSTIDRVADARLSTTSTKLHEAHGRADAYRRVREASRTDRGWPDAYAYALLATGRVDVVLDPIMSIWDTAALLPVVTEAGGRFSDWSGDVTHTAPEALATNGRLHDEVLGLIDG